MSDSPPDEIADETVFAAENIDEFVQRTRYQQIFEAKQRAADALREAEFRRLEALQQMSKVEADRTIQRGIREAVEAYVLECEPLYERTEAGQKLLHDVQIAEAPMRDAISIPAPDGKNVTFGELLDVEIIDEAPISIDRPTSTHTDSLVLSFGGVGDYLALSQPRVEYTYTVELPSRGTALEERSRQTRLTTPIPVSRDVFRATNALLHELGVGLEAGASDQEEIDGDYDSILDEL